MTLSEAITACYDPFPPEVIKIRQDAGTGNKALSYVGHPDYTRRLDALFPFAWDFRTEVAGITDSAVSVKGSLSITLEDGRTITRENYGHGQINKGFPLGDALKTAAVDAQKKCCSMFGIGLHLYDGDGSPKQQAAMGSIPMGSTRTTTGIIQHRHKAILFLRSGNPRRASKGLSVLMLAMIQARQRAARSLPCKTSPNLQRRIPRWRKRLQRHSMPRQKKTAARRV